MTNEFLDQIALGLMVAHLVARFVFMWMIRFYAARLWWDLPPDWLSFDRLVAEANCSRVLARNAVFLLIVSNVLEVRGEVSFADANEAAAYFDRLSRTSLGFVEMFEYRIRRRPPRRRRRRKLLWQAQEAWAPVRV
jgi:hypothetical protein